MNSDHSTRKGDNAFAEPRLTPLQLGAAQFRQIGYQLIDDLCAHWQLQHQPNQQPNQQPPARPAVVDDKYQGIFSAGTLPQQGADPGAVFSHFTQLLTSQGVSTAHPGFFAYIMGAGSQVSALADFLASAISPPQTSASTSPLTTVIEAQTIQWMAQLLNFGHYNQKDTVNQGDENEPWLQALLNKSPPDLPTLPPQRCGGLFVSGGSIANLVALKAALHQKVGFAQARLGIKNLDRFRLYTTDRAHSSIIAAADLCGLGQGAITVVATNHQHQLDIGDLDHKISADLQQGLIPLMVVGIAGCTSLGIIDPLTAIAELCQRRDIWFHVDAAYGGLAILAPQAPADLQGLRLADSVTIDPHKWMYAAADVGCILTKSADVLINTFSQGGDYYSADDPDAAAALQFRDLGPQTTRSFRALKVRMSLEIAGKQGYQRMISDDIHLAQYLYQLAEQHDHLAAHTCHLSITTLRFVPPSGDYPPLTNDQLNQLNQQLLAQLQQQGQRFPSHTWHQGNYLIRVCIVNLNTTPWDIAQLVNDIVTLGQGLSLTFLSPEQVIP